MIRILEIAWLTLSLLSGALTVFQFVTDGWEPALWMLMVTTIAVIMYRVRRKQRIKYQPKNETGIYH